MAVRAESRPDRVDDRELSQRLALAIDARLTVRDVRVATCGLHGGLARRSRPRQATGDASPLARRHDASGADSLHDLPGVRIDVVATENQPRVGLDEPRGHG